MQAWEDLKLGVKEAWAEVRGNPAALVLAILFVVVFVALVGLMLLACANEAMPTTPATVGPGVGSAAPSRTTAPVFRKVPKEGRP